MNRLTFHLLTSGAAFVLGNLMFLSSFYQSQQRILVSPYSTQQAIQIKDIPQPWQGLLRFGGSAIALSGAICGGLKLKTLIVDKSTSTSSNSNYDYDYEPDLMPNSLPQWDESLSSQMSLQIDSPPPPLPSPPAAPPPSAPQPNGLASSPSPKLDLLGEVAEYLVSQNGGHLLLSATTGSGKTSTILALMERIISIQPDTVFHVVDPKGTIWGGLPKENIIGVNLKKPDDAIQNVLELFEKIKEELETRKTIRQAKTEAGEEYKISPIILIIDEYLALLQAARGCATRGLDNVISKILETFAFFTREDNIKIAIISQSHLVSQLGFNTAARFQFALLCLAIGANSQSLKPAIMALSSDEFKNTNLLQEFYRLAAKFPNRPVAFSSLGATGRVELLPDLTGIKMRRIFSPPPPAAPPEPIPEPEPGGLTYLKTWALEQGLLIENKEDSNG